MTAPPSPFTSALADRYAIERELGQGGMATVYLEPRFIALLKKLNFT